MELGVYAVVGIAVIVAVAAFSRKLGVAAPIILVIVGVGLSYLPGVPEIEVEPELVLDVVLPPILYAAAISVPIMDFRRNLATITSLSVVLVIVTAFGVGFLLFSLLPDLNLAAAIALGAIISPPDAVAATSIGRRLGLPPRLLTVLEGEGLVNDATALVLLRSASAAAAGGMLTPWATVGDFVYAVVLAIIVGFIAGYVTVWLRSKLNDSVLDTAISIAVPFVAFMPTEALGGSGVLAVVIAGLYTGHASSAAFSAQARISDRINWRTIQFLLENAVFLLIGLEIRTLIGAVDAEILSVEESIGIGLVATAALIALRFLWVGPLVLGLRARERWAERQTLQRWLSMGYSERFPRQNRRWHRRRRRERAYERQRADLEQLRLEQIDWRGGVILSWSGMRGVVTLAAAQSLPQSTPYREQLVLIAFTVAVVTLVVQGGTLPWLIRLLKVQGIDESEDRRQLAILLDEISYAGISVLEDPASAVGIEEEIDPDLLERVRQSTFLRAEAAWERSRESVSPSETHAETPHRLYRQLRLAVVQAERERLLDARARGAYPSRILAEAQTMLDIEETRLRPPRADH
ncbi:cation:proton antiporter [Plantibacter sp. MPB07]|uniref:cation:proton antiporter n=1 Tax=Plantibacter sp. MPB07 TaxID=3388853 RepID=UPI003986B5F5